MEELSQITMIEQYLSGTVRLKDICERFKIHRATVWRKIQRLRAGGRDALVHGLRGRRSNNAKPPIFKERILALYAQYAPQGFNPWRFYHQVVRGLSECVSYSTVRRWIGAKNVEPTSHSN